jgi:hypothetical protein
LLNFQISDLPVAWGKSRLPAGQGRDLPKIQQPREPEPSTINEKTIADFTRVVEETRILERKSPADKARPPEG